MDSSDNSLKQKREQSYFFLVEMCFLEVLLSKTRDVNVEYVKAFTFNITCLSETNGEQI